MALQEAWQQNINSIFLPTIDPVNPLLTLFIRREHIVQDTLNQLSKQKRDDLKKPLKVMFIGEDGYDAGGVKKVFKTPYSIYLLVSIQNNSIHF